MDILPEVLADISVSFLPTDFKPFLFKTDFKEWKISAPARNASANEVKPTGSIINS